MSVGWEATDRSDGIHVELTGELDISSASTVESRLIEVEQREPERLILDLRRVNFIDSTGLSMIINADGRAKKAGRRLTIVSGAHAVSFGGTINVSGNPVAGVSINSKAGLDLDAASTLNSTNNGTGLLMQEASVMTVFNTPQFSGVPGFSTINANQNTGDGVRVATGSTLTLVNQARINSLQNARVGLIADDGVGLTLRSTARGATVR